MGGRGYGWGQLRSLTPLSAGDPDVSEPNRSLRVAWVTLQQDARRSRRFRAAEPGLVFNFNIVVNKYAIPDDSHSRVF